MVLTASLFSISGPMTGALVVYAATFMRYSLAVTPKNYLLFACHLTNFGAQTTQAYRYLNYWKYVPHPISVHELYMSSNQHILHILTCILTAGEAVRSSSLSRPPRVVLLPRPVLKFPLEAETDSHFLFLIGDLEVLISCGIAFPYVNDLEVLSWGRKADP